MKRLGAWRSKELSSAPVTNHDERVATEIRVLDGGEDLTAAANVFRAAMVGLPPLLNLAPGQIIKLLEPGRTVGAFVEGQLVGTADAVTSGLTLPGGAVVGHAAVTHIGVLPSFTRRGIATDLIRHQLRDIAARDEVVATLRASEAREQFAMYGQLPSYRAMLDRGGYAGPEDAALIGDEATVRDRLDEVRAAGVDESVAIPLDPSPEGRDRTRALISSL
ncbi:GNAT family N-acetyltransferase [Candidatus Mycobacterium methanotrophicum]|uniref:GNAT family N-acetyltransferase n=1 Tax=Candidatus Mycobacterium methanotrophicum TaxID=2943498 RepID=UPI0027D97D76|nr:GNAT family N-acetyltransferase [Candidatus Mycobacterium methanotrophicum]